MSKKLILKVGSKTIIWQLIKAKNFENKCFNRWEKR